MLRCTLHTPPSGHTVRVRLDPAPTDARLIAALLDGEARQAAVTFEDNAFLVPVGAPWQRLVGQLVVSAILALQPEYFFFHAAAVAIADHGVLLTGRSGSGKTSVSLALAGRGHGFLGDEIGAVRLATGTLEPVRRAALVRSGHEPQTPVAVSQVHPDAGARIVPLTDVVFLRRFAPFTRLEPVPLTPAHLDILTPLAASLHGADVASRVTRLFAHLGKVRGYALDAASPEEAAGAIERAVVS